MEGGTLRSGSRTYNVVNGVPILLSDPAWADTYSSSSGVMSTEYAVEKPAGQTFMESLRRRLRSESRSQQSRDALSAAFAGLPDNAMCLSVGGGPMRILPQLVNLNIGLFQNVDIVADAHELPYADSSVDAIYSEAVFEHLSEPAKAAREVRRVLKPGGRAYICTPFLQAYHGYPHHYQNFTLTGHRHLFASTGLKILEEGVCFGPTYTLFATASIYIREYVPAPLKQILRAICSGMSLLLQPLDRVLVQRPNAHVLATSTYLLLAK